MKFWIGVASKDHVDLGIQVGFAQVCHGKKAPLNRMAVGDWMIYYSPERTMRDKEPCQEYTVNGKQEIEDALGTATIADADIPAENNSAKHAAANKILTQKKAALKEAQATHSKAKSELATAKSKYSSAQAQTKSAQAAYDKLLNSSALVSQAQKTYDTALASQKQAQSKLTQAQKVDQATPKAQTA